MFISTLILKLEMTILVIHRSYQPDETIPVEPKAKLAVEVEVPTIPSHILGVVITKVHCL